MHVKMEKIKEQRKSNKGITLVALVITIILLLILAGITIATLTGENGILNKSKKADIETRAAQVDEISKLWKSEVLAAQYSNTTAKTLEQILDELEEDGLLTSEERKIIEEDENNEVTIGSRTISFKIDNENENFYIDEEFVYTGSEQSITLKPGKYVVECYGASGGYGKYNDTYKNEPGKGTRTIGILTLKNTTTLYLYVGGKGEDAPKGNITIGGYGGYNGGGNGGSDTTDNDASGGGGGATDIRLVKGEWNDTISLRSRIMVAAGGSGSTYNGAGLHGGTINGNSHATNKATQISGNSFGIGGDGTSHTSVPGSGAGGGYYGGFGGDGGAISTGLLTIGGSGSSYISGYDGCNAITSNKDETPSGQPVHYSGIKFEYSLMEGAINSGNGKITIKGGSNYDPPTVQQFSYTGNVTSVELKPGKYTVECYGASGGYGKYNDTYKYAPGKGAYTTGILTLKKTTTLYLYVGGKGEDAPIGNKARGGYGGYNGGGNAGSDTSDNDSSGGGGGASDIRLVKGEWNDAVSLRSRIMVAAGGSGSSFCGVGLHGGTINGNSNTTNKATQISGNSFGIGGNGTSHSWVPGSGAGGGYYGGFGGTGLETYTSLLTIGGSGSSYISGYQGCNAITSSEDETPSGQPVHYSGIKFENANMQEGINEGNGKIIITYIPNNP